MAKRLSLSLLFLVMVSALVLVSYPNLLQGQPPTQNVLRGNIRMGCDTSSGQPIFTLPTGNCPPVTIDIRNTGNCPIELVFLCAGQETARFGPQPRQRVTQTFPADEIRVNCQGTTGTRCQGRYTIRW
jgi:hypothetical protein